MRRDGPRSRAVMAAMLGLVLSSMGVAASRGADVSGVVRMPEVCSPSVSPAVVYLAPADPAPAGSGIEAKPGAARTRAELALVNQRGLQFTPRVQAIALGQTVRFTNQDGETHNVHVVTPGFAFNSSMAPGQLRDFAPEHPGVMTLACDIHIHMRGFVVVSPTPWVRVCSREGRFRLEGVPDGRYLLTAWHEMGEPLKTEVVVEGNRAVDLPALVLSGPANPVRAAGGSLPASLPIRPWAEVLDRISLTLAASQEAATRPGGAEPEAVQARRLAEDAYWGEFEASDMETAVRRHLGYDRAGELERQFRAFRATVRDVARNRRPASELTRVSHDLLLDLVSAARELDTRGVTDRSRVDAVVATADLGPASSAGRAGDPGDPRALIQALKRGFRRMTQEAERNGPDEAASELTTVYMTEFEPLERYLLGRSPQSVRPLELQFNVLRGDLSGGLKGPELEARLDRLCDEIEGLVDRLEAQPAGAFATAFLQSLITIVREGVEVILVLAMLIALVAKASTDANADPDAGAASRSRAMRAIAWGVALAVVASLATAAALNFLVLSAQGRARETLEGLVMLVAAGVLFYVSYWLVAQAEARRWMDFLKHQARRGLEWGGRGTLAVTAFLAVYREGAETSLMYQALLGSQGQTRPGLLGLAAGFALGLVILAAIALVIRATSVRLPFRTFFQLSGLFLFALAIIFAGNGVFELQNAGILVTTHLDWLGNGLPLAGFYPNLQVALVQGLLLAGALLAWVLVGRSSLEGRTA